MAEEKTQTKLDESLIMAYPVWEGGVWDALQNGGFEEAEELMEKYVSSLDVNEKNDVMWADLIEGFPMIRGGLSEKEWNSKAVPMVVRVMFNQTSGETLSEAMIWVENPNLQRKIHDVVIESIPGKELSEKIEWLRNNKPTFYKFLNNNLGQEMGLGLQKIDKNSEETKELLKYYESSPEYLGHFILDYNLANDLYITGRSNHLSEEKTNILAGILGRIFIGKDDPNELDKELMERLNTKPELAKTIKEEVEKEIIGGLKDSLLGNYRPQGPETELTDQDNIPAEPPASKFPKKTAKEIQETKQEEIEPKKNRDKPEQEKINKKEEDKVITPDRIGETETGEDSGPIIIHREEGKSKPFKKRGGDDSDRKRGFSFSLGGFFKKEGNKKEKDIKADVKTPDKGNKQKEKIVHYGGYKTPLQSDGEELFKRKRQEKEDIDSLSGKEENVPKPNNNTSGNDNENSNDDEGPSLEGNTVHLR